MKRILVVDDEPNIREAVRFVLQEEKYEIFEAENGTDALKLAIAQKPDLIISDVRMDNGNGFMLREILRDDPATASIPMILMTGAAQGAGAWQTDPDLGYLEKPFTAEQLLKAMSEISQDH